LLNTTGSTSGQAIVSTGPSSAPGWTAVANAGANTNITSLTGLTTPLGTWAGGLGANNSASTGIVVFSSGMATVTTTPLIGGVTNGACASAGNIGECKNSNIPSGSSVSLVNGTAKDVTSVSLTAGNWLCYGNVLFTPGGTTVTSAEVGFITSTSNTIPTTPNAGSYAALSNLPNTAGGNSDALPVGMIMENVTTTTSVYLDAYSNFTVSTMNAYGYINCIRIH
jgi:hypothetical protein